MGGGGKEGREVGKRPVWKPSKDRISSCRYFVLSLFFVFFFFCVSASSFGIMMFNPIHVKNAGAGAGAGA